MMIWGCGIEELKGLLLVAPTFVGKNSILPGSYTIKFWRPKILSKYIILMSQTRDH